MLSMPAAMPRARAAPRWSVAFARRAPASRRARERPAAAVRLVDPSSMSTWRRTKTSSSEDLARTEPDPLLEAGADGHPAPPSRRGREDRRRPLRIRSPHNETFLEACGDFAARVYKKADQDQI